MTLPTPESIWPFALAAVPAAIVVALVCRWLPCRASTRHSLWLSVLVLLAAAPFLPPAPVRVAQVAAPVSRSVDAAPIPHRPARVEFRSNDPARTTVDARPALVPAARAVAHAARRSSSMPPRVTAALPARPRAARATAPRPDPRPEPAPGAASVGGDARDASDRSHATRAAWLDRLAALRAGVASLPPLPPAVWGGGAIMLLLLGAWRIVRFQGLLRAARPAPAAAVRVVHDVARRLSLRRCPVVLVSDHRISPMVWCGRQSVLLLPRDLWAQLDDDGRRAVVAHELAHVKRRDHWWCWAEMVVGLIYWWHPVVWWVRRRLREEADLCCDAWVTALMPTARVAYARALLNAKTFTSTGAVPPRTPVVELGVSRVRARRFARRITMVMTAHAAPNRTLTGIALAGVIVAAAWRVTPTLAAPPTAPTPIAAAPRAAEPAAAPLAAAPPAPAPARAAHHEDEPRERRSIDERLDHVEHVVTELVERLEHWLGAWEDAQGEGGGAEALLRMLGRSEEAAPLIAQAESAYRDAMRSLERGAARMPGAWGGRTEARSYTLTEEKLAALTELMSRPDVPIIIVPHDDRIEVNATPEQHLVFEAFCLMIEGEDREEAYRLPPGKHEAMVELMARDDVPIMIGIEEDEITVQGTDLEQAVFRSFVEMIHPEHADESAASGTGEDEGRAVLR